MVTVCGMLPALFIHEDRWAFGIVSRQRGVCLLGAMTLCVGRPPVTDTPTPERGEDSDAYFELTTMANSVREDHAYITDEWHLTFGHVRAYVKEIDALRETLARKDAEIAARDGAALRGFAHEDELREWPNVQSLLIYSTTRPYLGAVIPVTIFPGAPRDGE